MSTDPVTMPTATPLATDDPLRVAHARLAAAASKEESSALRVLAGSSGSSLDPCWNLAVEEGLARSHATSATLRLWRNPQCVVVGRSQLSRAEVDPDVCRALRIPVLRRFTPGGAVYHDRGNLNVTVALAGVQGGTPGGAWRLPGLYALGLAPLAEAVRSLGMDAELTDREITVGGRKVSGVAAWRGRERTLVHATLLVDADLDTLARALAGPGAPGDRVWERTRSRRVPVTSLVEAGLTVAKVALLDERIAAAFASHLGREPVEGALTREERRLATRLYAERYARRGWHERGDPSRVATAEERSPSA